MPCVVDQTIDMLDAARLSVEMADLTLAAMAGKVPGPDFLVEESDGLIGRVGRATFKIAGGE